MMNLIKQSIWILMLSALSCGVTQAATPGIAVADFQNATSSASWWGASGGGDLASMVTNQLANSEKFKNNFNVVERAKLESILREQDLAEGGRISDKDKAKLGALTGAKYLVLGTLSAYEEDTEGTGGSISLILIRIGREKSDAYLAIDLRVVDTTTGEIVFARTVEGRGKSKGTKVSGGIFGLGGSYHKEAKTPTGKAVRAAVAETVAYLECVMIDKNGCINDFNFKEERRKESSKDAIQLEGIEPAKNK